LYKLFFLNLSDLKKLVFLTDILLYLACILVLILFLFLCFKNGKRYLLIKKWSDEVAISEKIWLNHLTFDTPFFGALKESLFYAFIAVNFGCLLNKTFFLLLITSKNEGISKLASSFLMLFLTLFLFSFLMEMWVLFFFNTFNKHPLFLFTKMICKYAVAGIGNAYVVDRVCISGLFEPPTNWAWCRAYQESQLGCVVRTKKELLAINEYRGLGLKGPLPYVIVNDIKELDIDQLEGQIVLKKKLKVVLQNKMEEAVDVAVSNFKADPTKSYAKNAEDLKLLTPPDTCPPGKNPASFEYDGDHSDRKAAAFRHEQNRGSKKY